MAAEKRLASHITAGYTHPYDTGVWFWRAPMSGGGIFNDSPCARKGLDDRKCGPQARWIYLVYGRAAVVL